MRMGANVEVVVIGAGQAGLAMGYFLQQKRVPYVLLDAGERIGDGWRKRYDSLVLFTPRGYSALPGMLFPGDQEGVPTKDEAADYLESYAKHFSLSVQLQTEVFRLSRTAQGFHVSTNRGEYLAKQVVVATGPFQKPFIPNLPGALSADVHQLHSAEYQSPADVRKGPVLVVGGGNTGVQLAMELAARHPVYAALGEERSYLPLRLWHKSIFWWFDKLGLLDASAETRRGAWLRKQKDPIFGLGPQFDSLVKSGKITSMPKVIGLDGTQVVFEGGERVTVSTLLWSTGFCRDYSWIEIPGVIGEQGEVRHQRGVSPIPGLYFLGLPWQSCRTSALLGGVGRDARELTEKLLS